MRNSLGDWEMQSFCAQDFSVLREGGLRSEVAILREIDADWKMLDDPLRELNAIRIGEARA